MAKCPKCNSQIEDDSLYCDQCGSLMYVCPSCHIIGKGEGKRCGNCGQQLVAATSQQGQQTASPPSPVQQSPAPQPPITPLYQPTQQQPAPLQSQPQRTSGQTVTPTPQGTIIPQATVNAGPTSLICKNPPITLQLIDDAMIGRDFSSVYARQLQGLGSMSRRHGKLIKNGSQWAFMDLGSSYGTTINGMSCIPNQQYSINTGDTIVFARTYTFNVN